MMGDNLINVVFFFQNKINLPERRRLKKFISHHFENLGKTSGEIRIIFCSDEYLLNINQNHLNHNYYTDIITFPFTQSTESHLEAELYISTDRVKENAKNNGVTFLHELHRVIFHGCLHLSGLNDKTETERMRMKQQEDFLLSQYCFT